MEFIKARHDFTAQRSLTEKYKERTALLFPLLVEAVDVALENMDASAGLKAVEDRLNDLPDIVKVRHLIKQWLEKRIEAEMTFVETMMVYEDTLVLPEGTVETPNPKTGDSPVPVQID